MVACILAGGQAKRLGGLVKSHLLIGEKQVIDWQLEVLHSHFTSIYVIGHVKHHALTTIPDIFPGIGPLGGIYTALKKLQTTVHVFPADNPFLSGSLIEAMIEKAISEKYDAIIPMHENYIEPLYGVYAPSALPIVELQIQHKQYAIYRTLQLLNTLYIDWNHDVETAFFNINMHKDIIKAQSYARKFIR